MINLILIAILLVILVISGYYIAFGYNETLLIENEDSVLPICYQKEIILDWCFNHYGGIGTGYGDKIQ